MLQKIVDLFWCWKFFRFCTSFFLFFFSFLFHLKKKDQKKKRRRRGEKKIIWISLFLFSAFIIIYRKRTKRRRRRTYTHKYTRYPSHPFFILFDFFLLLFCVHDDTDDDQKKLALIPPHPSSPKHISLISYSKWSQSNAKKKEEKTKEEELSLYTTFYRSLSFSLGPAACSLRFFSLFWCSTRGKGVRRIQKN